MIVMDIEATGLDTKKCSIVSLGALDFDNPENQFYMECRMFKGAVIEEGDGVLKPALEINGFTEEQVRNTNKYSLEELVKSFLEWTKTCKDVTIAGQNPATLDLPILNESFERYGYNLHSVGFGFRTMDLHSVALTYHLMKGMEYPKKDGKRSALDLDGILKFVGLPPEPKPHNALNGAKLEAEAFSRILYGKGLLKEYEKYSLPEHLKKR